MQLKNYQKEALKALDYFSQNFLKSGNLNLSYQNTLKEFNQKDIQYFHIKEFQKPYICLKLPTGGGKTLLATESIKTVVKDYLNQDYHLVFWLAPTDTIVTQTLKALKDKMHSYRKILDKAFDNVTILDINEAYSRVTDTKEELVIIVSTIQTFRQESKSKRKFFEENGNYKFLMQKGYEPTFENFMKINKPYIILDEAHKSSTKLSLKRLLDLNPSFILELTATPVTEHNEKKGIFASNNIYKVGASELKSENMIKLPIILQTINDYNLIIKNVIEKRDYLEELSKLEELKTSRYIRPIALFRAEENRSSDSITYDKIKDILMKDFNIKEEYIAIQTGKLRELNGLKLESKKCKIRYIITVEALKEGWDCPFAYVLGVVSSMKSEVSIEQLLGRVLRLPYVEEKKYRELNYSYSYVVSDDFYKVVENIANVLKDNGFEEMEAKVSISNSPYTNESLNEAGGLFGEDLYEDRIINTDNLDVEELVNSSINDYVTFNIDNKNLIINKLPSSDVKIQEIKKELKRVVNDETKHKEIDEKFKTILSANPTILGKIKDIELPKLLFKYDDELMEFEESIILDKFEWSADEAIKEAKILADGINLEVIQSIGEIDISKDNKLKAEKIDSSLFDEKVIKNDSTITIKNLSIEITKLIDSEDIIKSVGFDGLREFVYLLLSNMENRRINIYLMHSKKYLLKREVIKKIKELVQKSYKKVYNSLIAPIPLSF